MLVWEWMSHVSTEVCSNISNIIFIIVRSFLFCCCGQTWSDQAFVSHVRCDLTTQLFKKVSSHEVNEFFLIWNFSCNFIIIICSFLSAKNNAICTLQINQEKHLILPKLLFALCQLNGPLHVFNANEVRLHSKITFQFFQYLDPNLSNSLLFDRQWDPLAGFGRFWISIFGRKTIFL